LGTHFYLLIFITKSGGEIKMKKLVILIVGLSMITVISSAGFGKKSKVSKPVAPITEVVQPVTITTAVVITPAVTEVTPNESQSQVTEKKVVKKTTYKKVKAK